MRPQTPFFNFTQQSPVLTNEYTEDSFLKDYLKIYLPNDCNKEIQADLQQFGQRAATEFLNFAKSCEQNPPKLITYNAWGERIDQVITAPEWGTYREVAAKEGLVAIGYERTYGSYSRLYQFVKLYLFTPSSAMFSCPLAMSDGAARLIEHYGDAFLKDQPFKGLTSRSPEKFLTSGQWMTERTGGSDVSRSMTFAEETDDGYLIRGHKWFTSAIESDMAFTLASTELPAKGNRAPLSLFYMPIRNHDGTLNGIEIETLKDKLGSKALPTAQLKLTGAKARLVGEKEKGVKIISTLFNVTRIYNTITAVSYMRRAFSLSKAYGEIREAFGKKLSEQILFRKSLNELEIFWQSNALLAWLLARLLGKEDCKEASKQDIALLRLLTPVAKLYTAKGAIASASELIEMYGGLGYLEDSNIPWMLRDAQVLSIWEGTTNVLSLDMLRAIDKENALPHFFNFAQEILNSIRSDELQESKLILTQKMSSLSKFLNEPLSKESREGTARDLAFYTAELTIGLLWLEFRQQCPSKKYLTAIKYWTTFKMNEKTFNAFQFLQ